MVPGPTRRVWAVAFAALLGGVAGGFLGASVSLYSYGSQPIDGGDVAIFVGSLLGALVGAGVAAVVAYGLARAGWPGVGAVAGAMVGAGVGGALGLFAENFASDWISAYGSNPLVGALVGGGVAGAVFGVAAGAVVCAARPPGAKIKRVVQFAGLAGSVVGLFAGIGGGSVGASLAEAASVCPNGYFGFPRVVSGCDAGVLQGSLLFGMWIGAVVGAIAALATAEILTLIETRGRSFRNDL